MGKYSGRFSYAYFEKKNYEVEGNAIWSAGKPFLPIPGGIVVTPTNFPQISYLNLEEFSYDIYSENQSEHTEELMAECRVALDRHFDDVKYNMFLEYEIYIEERLRSQWDPEDMRRFLRYCRSTTKFRGAVSTTRNYKTFVKVLREKCKDCSLVVDFLKTVCLHKLTCLDMLLGPAEHLDFILSQTQQFGFDVWSLVDKLKTRQGSSIALFCPAEFTLFSGMLENLKILLKYGYTFSVSSYSSHEYNRIIANTWNENIREPMVVDDETRQWKKGYGKMNYEFTRRDNLIVELFVVFDRVLKGSPEWAHVLIDCWSLFYRHISDPHIPVEELYRTLMSHIPHLHSKIKLVCEKYEEHFPIEGRSPKQPRSLFHLSRCATRQRLRQTCQLPVGIDKLPIPKTIKSYLHLEW